MRDRPRARRRRAGQDLARRRPACKQDEHVHRFHRVAELPGRARRNAPDRLVIEGRSAGGLLMGAVVNLQARSVPRGAGSGAVRGRDQHDERHHAAAHRGRVRGVGESRSREQYRCMRALLSLHQPDARRLPGDAREDLVQRQPGDVLGAGQVRGAAAHPQDRRRPGCCSRSTWAPGTAAPRGGTHRLREIAFDYAFLLTRLSAFLIPSPPKEEGAG